MDLKTLKILAGVTAPLTLAAIFWPAPGGHSTARGDTARLLSSWKAGTQLTAMDVTGPGAVTHLTRHGAGKPEEGWVVTDKGGYPVPPATIKPVLDGLRALHEVEPKTAREKLFSKLGLETPGGSATSHEVVLKDAQGVVGNVILGRTKPADARGGAERIYARVPDGANAWLAEPSVTLPESALAWVDHAVVDMAADAVKRVVVTQTGGEKLELSRAKAGDALAVVGMPAGRKLKAEDATAEIAGALAGLELVDVRPAGKVTAPPAEVDHVETFDGLSVDVSVAKQDGSAWVVVSASGSGAAAKVADGINARVRGWAYAVSDAKAGVLGTRLADLLAPAASPASPVAPAGKNTGSDAK